MFVSMTGYGMAETATPSAKLTVEIKAVNAKFLDININAPRSLNRYDGEIRTLLSEHLSRGRISVYIRLTALAAIAPESLVNLDLAKIYHNLVVKLKNELKIGGDVTVSDLVNILAQVKYDEPELAADKEPLLDAVSQALAGLNRARRAEGKKLETEIRTTTERVKNLVAEIEKLTQGMDQAIRARLNEKIENLKLRESIDPQRLAQEILFYAERCDVREEVVRLKSHLDVLDGLIGSRESEGRKLNFLLQELGREINTINAKSVDQQIVHHGVDVKKSIEQMREQAQNIE